MKNFKKAVYLLSMFALLATMLIGNSANVVAADNVTFIPEEIPFSEPDIANPMRGYFNDEKEFPVEISGYYERFNWSDLEPEMDKYDFTKIDELLKKVEEKGMKAGMRFRAVSRPGSSMPEYLKPMMEKFWISKEGHHVPDWNDPDFLERARKLLLAIGRKYDGDKRIQYIDIGMYGTWGEWHLSPYGENAAIGAKGATPETIRALIDMHFDAFPNTRLVMMTGNDYVEYGKAYALSLSPDVGLRRDNLASPEFDKMDVNLVDKVSKTAPIISEPIDNARIEVLRMPDQIKKYKVLSINQINYNTWGLYNDKEKEALLFAGKLTGYRFVLNKAVLPKEITAGAAFNMSTDWSNMGVTPSYIPWNVTYQLKNKDKGEIVWQGASSLNLMNLLPAEKPVSISDKFTIPASVKPGNYDLAVSVLDPYEYLKPLALAIKGRNTDGSYTLGTIEVRAGTIETSTTAPVAAIADIEPGKKAYDYANLVASGSYDPDGYIVSYKWDVTGKDGFKKTLYGASTKVALLKDGDYEFKLTVKDNQGNEAEKVIKTSAEAIPPIVIPTPAPAPEIPPRPVPTPNPNPKPSEMLEDFEAGTLSWNIMKDAGYVQVESTKDTPDESSAAAKLTFSGNGNYQYFFKQKIDGSRWVADGRNSIRIWLKGDPSNNTSDPKKFKIQLREFSDEGERWSYNIGNLIGEGEWKQIVIPLDPSAWEVDGGAKYRDNEFSLKDVAEFRIYCRKYGAPINITVDRIEITNQEYNPRTPFEYFKPLKVTIDGKEQKYDQVPLIINEKTMVPMRSIFEALGARVEWDGKTGTVTATKDKTTIVLKLGESNAQVNGKGVALEQPPQLINEKTMVPARFVSEAMGAKVEWNEATWTVVISTKAK